MAEFKLPNYETMYLYTLAQLQQRLAASQTEDDRTGTGTTRAFGLQLRCDLRTDFPLLNSKKVFTRGIIEELLWFLRGETNIESLEAAGVYIWSDWADSNGDLGPVYGAQWRNWNEEGIDQIDELIRELKANPSSRRMIVSAWNPSVLPNPEISPASNANLGLQALPPCHTLWQCFSQEMTPAEQEANPGFTRWLDLQLYQRSADWFLGVPFNAVSYSLLLMMLAKHVGMAPRNFIHTFGDVHLYANHLEQASEQLSRDVSDQVAKVSLNYPDDTPLDQIRAEDIVISNYEPAGAIKAPISV